MAVTNEEKRLYSLLADAPNAEASVEAQQAAAALRAGEQAARTQANYSATADGKLDEAISQYLNQNGYRYDINNDNAYREFAREYNQGALNGRNLSVEGARRLANGYAATYADTAANEVYNDQTARVGEYAPQFEKLAAQEAAAKQQSSGNLVSLYGDMAQREYGRERDTQGDRMNFLNYLASRYQSEKELEAQKNAADTSVYNTRLGAMADDLAAARQADAQRAAHVTQSAYSRAKIAEDEYENNQKIAYNRAKDSYDDRIAAEKAAAQQQKADKTAAKQAATASAKEQEAAEKAARQHRINQKGISQFLLDKKEYGKLTPTQKVDWDYNDDGKIDTKDLALAEEAITENDIKSGKGLTIGKDISSRGNVREIMLTIREMKREDRYKNKSVAEIAAKVIPNSDNLNYPEKAWLYEYYGLG